MVLSMKRCVLFLSYLCFFSAWPALAQWQKPSFKRLSTNEGLSQSTIHGSLMDSQGFMWFCSNEGLNRYDGERFTIYKHDPADETSLGSNIVYDALEDKTGTLWIATNGGLDRFDRNRNNFSHYFPDHQLDVRDILQDTKKRIWLGTTTGLYLLMPQNKSFSLYKHNPHDKGSLSDNVILKLAEDQSGHLWIATQHGLNRFNPETKHCDHFFHDPQQPGSLPSSWIKTVFVDQKGTVWAGTLGGGIARYHPTDHSFTNFRHDPGDPTSIGHNDILSLMEDDQGDLWVGTENGGISVYHPATNRFTTFGFDPTNSKSLSNNSVYSLYKDRIGNIWAGTYSGGVNYLPKFGDKFRLYRNIPSQNSLSNNIVLDVEGGADGILWFGTDGGGLNRFDPKRGLFTAFKHETTNRNTPSSDYIITVVGIQNNLLALGYHRTGFDLFDTQKRIFTPYVPTKNNPNDLPTTSVNTLFRDKDTNLWLGSWGQGLYVYDRPSRHVTQYKHDPNDANSLCDDHLNAIYEDETGGIWLGTENGLDLFDRTARTFTHFRHDPRNNRTINSNTINCIVRARKGYVWIGTTGGLCLLDTKTRRMSTITEKDGLPNEVVNALIEDHRGNLWISTNKGICRYNPRLKTFRNYDISDGLQGNEFKVGSVFRTADGTIIFGGSDGFNTFHPDRIQDNPSIPPVYITDFQVFNRSVQIGDADSLLTKHITQTQAITLRHDQDVFSFEFAALNYTLPEKNQYAYKLEGFDKDWNYVGNKRNATYTNLDQGDYTFRVKASNNDGVWNEQGTAISITILPPYWETWWFKTLVVALIVGSAYTFYRVRTNVIKAQKWALEQIIEERTERLHQEQVLNRMKSQFVSTASHEFRTPLATIQSSVDLVGMYIDLPPERAKPQIQKHLSIVEKEIGKFSNLLDDILTIEKMNSGKVTFSPQLVDIGAICQDVITTHFSGRKDHRSVDISVTGTPRLLLLDEKLISQALVNLLSNAFKFSDTNPSLHLRFDEELLMIQVSDQGVGIPKQDLPHLFETFFRAGNVSTIQGTGLGLFIARQSVERHGGSIQVESLENEGSTFTITLPAAHNQAQPAPSLAPATS